MARLALILLWLIPLPLAWAVTGNMCGFSAPKEINCFHASDGYWEVFFSFLIMFAIAVWVPLIYFVLIRRSRGKGAP